MLVRMEALLSRSVRSVLMSSALEATSSMMERIEAELLSVSALNDSINATLEARFNMSC